MTEISIRAPAKGATIGAPEECRVAVISIRAPAKGATNIGSLYKSYFVISIRAPAKGATKLHSCTMMRYQISIRAPAKGATSACLSVCSFTIFQSALPRRERRTDKFRTRFSCNISIRAPAKGATKLLDAFPNILPYFNPRSREGSDSNIIQQFSFFCIILYILSVIT